MSGTALIEPSSTKGLTRREGRVLRPSQFIVPIACLLIVGGMIALINSSDLDSQEARALTVSGLLQRTWTHIEVAGLATIIVIVISVPLGVLLTRPRARFLTPLVLGIANIGQAIPSIGLIVLFVLWLGIGFQPVLYALVLYAILPVLRNTIVGLRQVDPALIEAGRGMGMSAWNVLLKIEMRLAVPVIVAGVRVALVLLVGTAALGAMVNVLTLGDTIITGIQVSRDLITLTGAAFTAVLALMIDWLASMCEQLLRPRGLR